MGFDPDFWLSISLTPDAAPTQPAPVTPTLTLGMLKIYYLICHAMGCPAVAKTLDQKCICDQPASRG
jgi:hypothetical protein